MDDDDALAAIERQLEESGVEDPASAAAEGIELAKSMRNSQEPGEAAKGLEDFQNVVVSQGLPVARVLYRQLIVMATDHGDNKKHRPRLMELYQSMCFPEGIGSNTCGYEFVIPRTGQKKIVVLRQCKKNYDMGAKLREVMGQMNQKQGEALMKFISQLIYTGRTMFMEVLAKKKEFIELIAKCLGPARANDLMGRPPPVDPATTTIFLTPNDPVRVGLFFDDL